ncbi:hypothetical protein MBLNU457_6060t1 [Dothideomycetes sp. NU457]
MTLQLYVGHNGQSLRIDTSRITTLDALRTWVAQSASIQPARQVFLTSKGKVVRPQTLLTESEIFVFDSSLLSGNFGASSSLLVEAPQPVDYSSPPDTIKNQTDVQSWQRLFRSRYEWANELRNKCAELSRSAQRWSEEQAVIQRSLTVAIASLQIHTRSAEQKQQAAESWADELLHDHERRIQAWKSDFAVLRQIPAKREFARFVQSSSPLSVDRDATASLQSFLGVTNVENAASGAQTTINTLNYRIDNIRRLLGKVGSRSSELMDAVEQMQAHSSIEASVEPSKLMDEVEIILRKISSDKDHVISLSSSTQSVSQASKMALLHTRNYLPNLQEYAAEMNDLVQRSLQQRNNAADSSVQHMRTLASIESQISKAYTEIKNLDMPENEQQAFTLLNVIARLPYAYGSLMVESVRRREWITKMKKDSSALAEEMATYQEEEEKRRKKWLNSIDDVVRTDMMKSKTLGIEVNLQAEEDSWPVVTRQELDEYISILTQLNMAEEGIEDLRNAIRSLDTPTKKQIKHAKTFKNGSMHEAAFGSTSLMLRGEDEYKVLREVNTKLEEDLRGQKSRVRKLEDLLHRQTSTSRVNTADVFIPQIELVSDPVSPYMPSSRFSDSYQRQSSMRSRTSSNAQEEQKLAKRIVTLEADLHTLQQRNTDLEREAQSKQESQEAWQRQIDEAISTKQDIMQNMESQQREFALERKNLEEELRHARTKIEELEDEFDRVLGSRDNERSGLDARTRDLENEMEAVKTANSKEVEELQQQLQAERDRNNRLESEVQAALQDKETAKNQSKEIQMLLDEKVQTEEEVRRNLTNAHAHLSPGSEPPQKYSSLGYALEELAQQSFKHTKDLTDALAMAKAANDNFNAQLEARFSELEEAKHKEQELQDQLDAAHSEHASSLASTKALTGQLEDEREQLRILRSKFADGETGADALRQRVSEEESRNGDLSEQIAIAQSHIQNLEAEVQRLQERAQTAESTAESITKRLRTRGERSMEVSQRLYAQNATLYRLLETLGFAVSQRDSSMVVERASKVGASLTLAESQNPLVRASSYASPPATRKPSDAEDLPPDTSVHWGLATTTEDEDDAYQAYMQKISLFSTSVFSDAIAKRYRDFEYTARKWQKEAKQYREKATRLQSEAHTKIAVRDFKEGDLALFLPTKGKAVGAWAAFNINAPHHFLAEREGMTLARREWLVARISRVEERVVNLSRSLTTDGRSINSTSDADGASCLDYDNDNPFDLSDGLTWYLVHAAEEKSGAPTTPGLGKSTVSATNVDAKGSVASKKRDAAAAQRTLNKSLESRRSSSTSKVSAKGVAPVAVDAAAVSVQRPPPPQQQQQQQQQEDTDQRRGPVKSAERASSPSKSIRSLARHLERGDEVEAKKSQKGNGNGSPTKTPTKERNKAGAEGYGKDKDGADERDGGGGGGWKSLWSLDYEIESPRK